MSPQRRIDQHGAVHSTSVAFSKAGFPSLALRALRKRKPQETQAIALASSQAWLPLLRPIIPIGWRLLLLRENFTQHRGVVQN